MPIVREIDSDPVDVFMDLEEWPISPPGYDVPRPIPVVAVNSEAPSSSSSSRPTSSMEPFLVGYVPSNVVGLQHYSARINGRELLSLVREPLNHYDPNAIQVFNLEGSQVGHIGRHHASILAPLLDDHVIIAQCITKMMIGRRNTYNIPCEIHIFARMEAFERVKYHIARHGLILITETSPAFSLSEAAAVKEKGQPPDERTVDCMFKMLDEALSREGALEALEPPNDVIKTPLFSHQKEGLGWLVHRENSDVLPPLWEKKEGLYVNLLTNHHTNKRPDPLQGGIFADDMGLGKSLTLLSLIAFDKCACPLASFDTEEDNESVSGSGSKLKRGMDSSEGSNFQKKQRTEGILLDKLKGKLICGGPSETTDSKTTLIVCPTSVFSAWVKQLEVHTRPGSLKTYMYYGKRTKDPKKLQKYDIVLTTYSTLATELSTEESPMEKIEWWRIILDEAHLIKNANAQQSRAVTSLNAKRRWVVTGTPIQNDSFDMYSLMAFLRLEPLSTRSIWNDLIAFPLAQGNTKGISRLQVLMATISLRRTKEKTLTGFPSKTIETFFVDLSQEERDVYDRMEAEARKLIQRFISAEHSRIHYTNVLSILIRLRQICVDLELCPPDFQDLPAMEDASKKPELLNKLKLLVEDNDSLDLDCPVCISTLKDAVITSCAHIFCRVCILKTLRESKQSCPLCRRPLQESDLFFMPPDAPVIGSSSSSKSSKVIALLKLLSASRDENPNRKSVIFSQFRKMLLSLEVTLKAAGFKVLRVDGSMTARKRGQVIEEFSSPAPNGPTILLASLKATGAGVNLTAASRVYLLEPWWNPAVEEQAMDRVHRIGQTEDVKVVRMIARNTVEEKILQLQANKKLLANKAFGRKGTREQREISRSDIAALMDL